MLTRAADTDMKDATEAVKIMLTGFQKTFGAVAYYNEAYLAHYFDKATADMYALANEMATYFPGWQNFPAILKEFDDDQKEFATIKAQAYMTRRLQMIVEKFGDVGDDAPPHILQLLDNIKIFAKSVKELKFSDTQA